MYCVMVLCHSVFHKARYKSLFLFLDLCNDDCILHTWYSFFKITLTETLKITIVKAIPSVEHSYFCTGNVLRESGGMEVHHVGDNGAQSGNESLASNCWPVVYEPIGSLPILPYSLFWQSVGTLRLNIWLLASHHVKGYKQRRNSLPVER